MKKILLSLAVLALAAGSAFGAVGVDIQWTTLWGAYDHTAADLTGSTDYLLDSYSMTWQLIYSVNNTAGAPDLGNSANGWVSGDDTVWATRTLAQSVGGANVVASDGTEWYNYLGYVSGDEHYLDAAWAGGDVGYVFQRIYEGAPAVNSWYFDSTPVALDSDPVTFQDIYPDTPGAGFQPDQQIPAVPEPATMGLLGLGALVMAIRRRRS